ncbi:hypothetical protein R3P38DRAFT_3221262 [Favolaschia claudopus]|uniref:Uncharacterized protein n=1 Tax=Favolaschia claudopus TaxID=2862362 RepID=A0AAV9ZCU3_9AGAR
MLFVDLGPDCEISPQELRCFLLSKETEFLGAAKYEKHIFPPLLNDTAYTIKKPNRTPSDPFQPLVFGQISSLPVCSRDVTSIKLQRPNWSVHGWGEDDLREVYSMQVDSLDDMWMVDFHKDCDRNITTRVRNFVSGNEIVIDLWRPTHSTDCYYPDISGWYRRYQVSKEGTNFPFCVGDTVVIQASLHQYQEQHPMDGLFRDYSIVAYEMVHVRPRLASQVACPSGWQVDNELSVFGGKSGGHTEEENPLVHGRDDDDRSSGSSDTLTSD